MTGEQVITFGPFELHRSQRILRDTGHPVRLGSRAFEILVALLERPGQVVTKEELVARAWPGAFVESSNLRVHIAALRKALRDDPASCEYIRSVSGRGYSFVASVAQISRDGTGKLPAPTTPPGPHPAIRIIGRERAIDDIAKQVKTRRLLSIVGPGGIGKSTVALAATKQLTAHYANKLHFIDLSVIDDPTLTATAVATAVGISALTTDPIRSVSAFLRNTRLLLVLDNCEHVIEGAARLIDAVLHGTTGVDILVTSREPLLVQDEAVYRLDSLDAPQSVELFLERAAGKLAQQSLTDADARDIATICARLDGIPLAIELAAARVDVLGIRALAAQLDGRLLLLSKGRRTAQPRHKSLRAMLDWSYDMLGAREQTLLRRMSVFRSSFSAQAAAEVVADASLDLDAVDDGMIVLAGKSLANAESANETVHYRLLQTTRAYGFQRLEADPIEHAATAQRHAEHLCRVLTQAQAQWETLPRQQWLAQYGRLIDDVRAALEWAFGPTGDVGLGAALTAASLPFGFQLAQIDEFTRRAERALRTLAVLEPPQPVAELRLAVALAGLLCNTGVNEPRVRDALRRASALADHIGRPELEIAPLTVSTIFELELGNYTAAVERCAQLVRAAGACGDPLALLTAQRTSAQSHHFAGDHVGSRKLAERVLQHPARAIPLIYSQTAVDKAVSMRIILARILWLQGQSDAASLLAEESLSLASSDGPFAMCQALALAACPIALWRGDASVDGHVENLLQFSSRYTLHHWHALGLCLQDLRQSATTHSSVGPASVMQRDLLATLSERWIDAATIARARSGSSGWCAPEVLRVAAELELRRTSAHEVAEAWFLQAIELAHAQQALAWELRAVISLARLLGRTDRKSEARSYLEPVYEQFAEGHHTSDLRAAADLLDSL